MQAGQQLLPPGQHRRTRRQRHRPTRYLRLLVDQLVDTDATAVSENPARPYVPGEPGPGWSLTGPGPVGPSGATFPWITPAATLPRSARTLTSPPAATARSTADTAPAGSIARISSTRARSSASAPGSSSRSVSRSAH
jgi:hypothetical protein